jgi:hypothetical protein
MSDRDTMTAVEAEARQLIRNSVVEDVLSRFIAQIMEVAHKSKAAAIDTLTAKCDAVMKDRAHIMAERDRTFAVMLERAEKAEARVERMREALVEIDGSASPDEWCPAYQGAVDIARAAIAEDAP